MDTFAEETRLPVDQLPADLDAQPLVQAAADLHPQLRDYHEEIEREQRMPPALFAQLREAGFYKMVIPRSLGGLQVDPLTYLRVVERLAGGYRVTGRWQFGSGCNEASWMLGSFQVLGDDGQPLPHPDGGSLYWRGVFARTEVEIVPGSWDVAGLRGTGSFDWTAKNVFLPERRTMPQVGIPLENQWSRWPGLTYQLPVQCWVGPHHSAVITGIARAGIDALIELAGGKQPRGRPVGLLCDSPQVQDAVG